MEEKPKSFAKPKRSEESQRHMNEYIDLVMAPFEKNLSNKKPTDE